MHVADDVVAVCHCFQCAPERWVVCSEIDLLHRKNAMPGAMQCMAPGTPAVWLPPSPELANWNRLNCVPTDVGAVWTWPPVVGLHDLDQRCTEVAGCEVHVAVAVPLVDGDRIDVGDLHHVNQPTKSNSFSESVGLCA